MILQSIVDKLGLLCAVKSLIYELSDFLIVDWKRSGE